MPDVPHLKGHVHRYISNLVDVWQRPSIVLTPVGSQLQILGLLELQLRTQRGEMQQRINKDSGCRRTFVQMFSVDTMALGCT